MPNNTQSNSELETTPQEQGRVKGLAERQTRLEQVMAAIIVVLFIGFAAVFVAATSMLVDNWRSKQTSYQQLELLVQAQNDKIDQLIQSKK